MVEPRDDDDDDLRLFMDQLIEQVVERVQAEQWLDICDDCFIRDESVRRQDQFSGEEDEVHLYLCEHCSKKRKDQAEQVLEDLQCLAREVEQRLEAIENTERELDQWRDDQLQKNRDFWDEYRRQVENFSACRIRTLQYEFTMKQMQTHRILRRLERIKYLVEHFDRLPADLLPVSFVALISSETFQSEFSALICCTDASTTANDDRRQLFEQISSLDYLDHFLLPGEPPFTDTNFANDAEP